MINKTFMRVALRYRAIYYDIDRKAIAETEYRNNVPLMAMTRRLAECGYIPGEELLHALSAANTGVLADITSLINDVCGINLNWMPLVKDWTTPTGESAYEHLVTWFANLIDVNDHVEGTTLPCGHFIPDGTFHLEHYNGCPFCGKPFRTATFVYKGQGSKLKELRLFTMADIDNLFNSMLTSPVPLDATQFDSLKLLAAEMEIPADVEIPVKESRMAVISTLIAKGKGHDVLRYMSTPTDVLRYLWYEKTDKAVIIRPKYLINTASKWHGFLGQGPYAAHGNMGEEMKRHLRLKYNRAECRRVATWLNAVCTDARKAAEDMHPYRGMWVRFIRALRLAEYCKKPGFERLAILMDVFYREDYSTWGSEYNHAINMSDRDTVLRLLSARPGMFARCLFASILHFGVQPTLAAFRRVAQQVPPRLVLSLANAAEDYFNPDTERYASPLTGGKKRIGHNKLLTLYSPEELGQMVTAVNKLYEEVMADHFAAEACGHKSVYIDPALFDIPVGVGDRATTIQDASCALQGTRFKVEGDKVRLFMQWGVGLPAQYLDMDLSAIILYDNKRVECAYHHLVTTGAKHSGDIRSIPDKVGTAEYVELDIPVLGKAEARYVVFTCNAYSSGQMSPRLQVGWMSSEHPMRISEKTGVAYDPSCVQHIVRVADDNITKGMTFGVLDVESREITWLELANHDQAAFLTDVKAVIAYMERLRSKCSIGRLLAIKAQAQGQVIKDNAEEAECAYTYEWALNPAEVSALLG